MMMYVYVFAEITASFLANMVLFILCSLLLTFMSGQEWQAKQREKTKELHRRRQEEDEKEERKVDEYREIGLRLKDYPEEELRKAKKLVSSFIKSAEEVEEVIILCSIELAHPRFLSFLIFVNGTFGYIMFKLGFLLLSLKVYKFKSEANNQTM